MDSLLIMNANDERCQALVCRVSRMLLGKQMDVRKKAGDSISAVCANTHACMHTCVNCTQTQAHS